MGETELRRTHLFIECRCELMHNFMDSSASFSLVSLFCPLAALCFGHTSSPFFCQTRFARFKATRT